MRRPRQRVARARVTAAVAAIALVIAGCSGGPILANPPLTYPTPAAPTAEPPRAADPIPIELPRDDGPHDRLTEWWYYTGHLSARDGRRFGFEAVVFRAERGPVPTAWASHLALTDEGGQRFLYAQRSEVGPQVDRSPVDASGTPTGFDLNVAGLNPDLVAAGAPPIAPPWRLAGSGGTDTIEAVLAPEEATAAGAAFGLRLDLEPVKPAALHDGDGFIDFGPGGSSYYYSRTRLGAAGELTLDGERLEVDGIAWFDHQWGDFISVGGGWDWFAINLDNGMDITISIVHDPRGGEPLQYGTIVDVDGATRHLDAAEFRLRPSSVWGSPATGRRYTMPWHLTIHDFVDGRRLIVNLQPTLEDQEIDARATTGVIYWEGSQVVRARLGLTDVELLGGEAYIEMTRYGG